MLPAALAAAAPLAPRLTTLLTGLPTLAALLPTGSTTFATLGGRNFLRSALLPTTLRTVAHTTTLGALAAFPPALSVLATWLVATGTIAALPVETGQPPIFPALASLAVFPLASRPIAGPVFGDTALAVTVRICPKRIVVFAIRNPISVDVGILVVGNSISVHIVVF